MHCHYRVKPRCLRKSSCHYGVTSSMCASCKPELAVQCRMLIICAGCRAPLEPEDGHMECPACLGIDHLRQGLTEFACMSCTCISRTALAARLVQVEAGTAQAHERADERAPVLRPTRRRSTTRHTASKSKRKKGGLAQKVDSVTTELERLRGLWAHLQTICSL